MSMSIYVNKIDQDQFFNTEDDQHCTYTAPQLSFLWPETEWPHPQPLGGRSGPCPAWSCAGDYAFLNLLPWTDVFMLSNVLNVRKILP